MDFFLAAGGGFLVAVLWMDLMFDVLALRERSAEKALAEEDLLPITTYYHRVTTTAWPMNQLIGVVMAAMVLCLLAQFTRGDGSAVRAVGSLLLCGVPITVGLARVFPNAIRLGARSDSYLEQSRLARLICWDHLCCVTAMVAFLALRGLGGR